MASDPRSLFGMDCIRCGNELIAPENTEYVDHQLIRHVWHCPKCHARFETFPRFPTDVRRVKDLTSQIDVFPPDPLAPQQR
jgi:transcriptional regulator NrdR family protein